MKRTTSIAVSLVLLLGGVSVLTFLPSDQFSAMAQERTDGDADPGASAGPAAPVPTDGGTDQDGQEAGAGSVPDQADATEPAEPAPSQAEKEGGGSAGPVLAQPAQPPAEQPAPEEAETEGGPAEAPIFDVPTSQISFEAVLTDGGGNPLPGPTVNLDFRIYNSAAVVVEGPISLIGVPIDSNGLVVTQVPVSNTSFDGSERLLGVTVNPPAAELVPRILLTAVPYAFRVDRVASAELDDVIALGDTSGASGSLTTFGTDGLVKNFLFGAVWGELNMNDGDGNQTVSLDAQSNSGGSLTLNETAGAQRVSLRAAGSNTGGELELRSAGGLRLELFGDAPAVDNAATATNSGGINLFNDAGIRTIALAGSDQFSSGGELQMFNDSGGLVFDIDTGTAGAFIGIRDGSGTSGNGLTISTSTTSGTSITGFAADGTSTVFIDSDSLGAGFLSLDQNDGSSGLQLDGDNGTDAGGRISVMDSVSSARVTILGESTGTGGEISVFDDDGTETVEILGAESSTQGAQILLRKADGTGTIEIDADFNNDGRIITQELQITGGSDLSEQFEVQAADDGTVQPGMVVSIDPERPGKLVVSTKGYDRTVAGIISGAGGVETGVYMGQKGSEEVDGQFPVALTGRVYVFCDATQGPIVPGDLLTTSETPGHAMKVGDYAKAQGAILGKAMTPLAQGRGLVLVLVTLQ